MQHVQSAVCFVRGSQYTISRKKPEFSFKGPSGLDFAKNIFYELQSSVEPEKNALIGEFSFVASLQNFLRSIRIPFLYGIDKRNAVFEEFSCFKDDFFVQCYQRTSNRAQIDGKFTALQEISPNEFVPITVACECKNRSDDIGASLLFSITAGFERNDAKIGFIVCTKAVDNPSEDSLFALLCEHENYHVYRSKWVSDNAVHFEDFFGLKRHRPNPKMVILIYETAVINHYAEETLYEYDYEDDWNIIAGLN